MMHSPWQQHVADVQQAFQAHKWLWLTPTLLMTSAAVLYAAVRPTTWKASQALVVRDEAVGTTTRHGRFENSDTMKAFQETILEVARSPIVVAEALRQVNQAHRIPAATPPTDQQVRSLQKKIDVSAPKGSEFGSTEVIYLSVTGRTREAAVALTDAVCDQLERHLANLRNARAASVISELEETLHLALTDLQEATERLQAMERDVGSDLSELRVLNQSGAGEGNLRLALNQITLELRQATTTFDTQQQQRELLLRARDNHDELLATPSQFLESQPALRRLKDGLVDAQLRTSDLRGRMSLEHPQVQAALRAEAEVRSSLQVELDAALRTLSADLQVSRRQVESLEQQHHDLQARLDRLASLRASYAALVEEVRRQTTIVDQAKKDLSDARARRNASQSSSLITRFQAPQAGGSPVGPGRATIVGAGLVGGLLTGTGIVFLVAPLGAGPRGRRWTDYLPIGRRATDRTPAAVPGAGTAGAGFGRRAEDRPGSLRERRQSRRRAEDRPPAAEQPPSRGTKGGDAPSATTSVDHPCELVPAEAENLP